MKDNILSHFKSVDLVMHALALDTSFYPLHTSDTYFLDLTRSIINQQLSEKAGATIYNRFLDHFPQKTPTIQLVLNEKDDALRQVGISYSKISYIKNVAEYFNNTVKDTIDFMSLSNEEVIHELTKIKGIGKWTAEMFCMFSLGREDIFSIGDVGLQRAIHMAYAMKQKPIPKDLLRISKKWSPYRTYACRILWNSLDNK
ncbi:DNA-3-methyladenine glycosylase family protein [Patescibacteria group bacterium]